jgi:aquaporin related protein
MMLVGATGYTRGALIIISQILAGIAASGVVSAMMPNVLAVRTELGGGTTVVQGLFIEVRHRLLKQLDLHSLTNTQMFLTAQLVFTIFMLATEKHEGTFIAPVGIGLSLFVAELMGVFYTGGSVNPARSFGPAVVSHTFNTYHWIYWVGPMLGAILASCFYMFIKALEYETVNLVADPKTALGEKYAHTNRPQTADTGHSADKIITGSSGDTFNHSSNLENGHAPHA